MGLRGGGGRKGERGEVRTLDALLGDEEGFELLGEVAAVFGAVGGEGDAQGQGGRRDVVAGGDVEAGDALVSRGETADVDLGAHAVDVQHKLHRGLAVGVDEAVRAERLVPLRGQAGGEARAFGFWTGLASTDKVSS